MNFFLHINRNLIFITGLSILFLFIALRSSFSVDVGIEYYLQLLLKPIRIMGILLGTYCLVMLVHKYDSRITLLHWVFYAISIHAFIMVLQLISVEFKEFVYGYLNTGEYRSTVEYQFRMGGLTGGSGGAVLSVIQSIGCILTPYVLSEKKSILGKFFIYACSLLCFVSVISCGRSGLLAIFLFTPIALILMSTNTAKTLLNLLLAVILFIFLIIGLSVLINLLNYSGVLDSDLSLRVIRSFSRSMDSIFLIMSTGEVQDSTISTLINHIIFPNSFQVLLFGDPVTLSEDQMNRTLNSDIGYIRNIWGFGIFGSLLYWSPLMLMQLKLLLRVNSSNVRTAALIIGLVMIFFHAKELFFYVRMLFPIYCILFFQSHLTEKDFGLENNSLRRYA